MCLVHRGDPSFLAISEAARLPSYMVIGKGSLSLRSFIMLDNTMAILQHSLNDIYSASAVDIDCWSTDSLPVGTERLGCCMIMQVLLIVNLLYRRALT